MIQKIKFVCISMSIIFLLSQCQSKRDIRIIREYNTKIVQYENVEIGQPINRIEALDLKCNDWLLDSFVINLDMLNSNRFDSTRMNLLSNFKAIKEFKEFIYMNENEFEFFENKGCLTSHNSLIRTNIIFYGFKNNDQLSEEGNMIAVQYIGAEIKSILTLAEYNNYQGSGWESKSIFGKNEIFITEKQSFSHSSVTPGLPEYFYVDHCKSRITNQGFVKILEE